MSEATGGEPAAAAGSGPALKRFPCTQCGAKLVYAPGAGRQRCAHCGFENDIPVSGEQIREEDFRARLAELARTSERPASPTVKCSACAAEVDRPPGVTALACPFCGADMVDAAARAALIPPKSLLPFKIARDRAQELFRGWIRRRWFAPNQLKRYARQDANITGMYVPYWTYDCNTKTWYAGERGDDYWVTESYTATENGKRVTRTRRVRRTRWTPASGLVFNDFDDLLVLASESLPRVYVDRLEPWDLPELVSYADEYLSGFRAERYQIGLEQGFERAKDAMAGPIRSTICGDIGGDHQRVHSSRTQYDQITFKHLLLPVWISAYRYRRKTYRFLVNARTGEVQGERPWSWIKIALAVLAGLAIVGSAIWLASRQ